MRWWRHKTERAAQHLLEARPVGLRISGVGGDQDQLARAGGLLGRRLVDPLAGRVRRVAGALQGRLEVGFGGSVGIG